MNENITAQLADIIDPEISAAVWELVKTCDAEFVPPLHVRDSTVSRNFASDVTASSDEPIHYFDMLKKQYVLIARLSSSIVGFLSFRHNYSCVELDGWNPSNYITTICVHRDHRHKGIGTALYLAILSYLPDALQCNFTTTRTWDGNEQHTLLLKAMGFQLARHIVNNRGDGFGSTYWVKCTLK